MFSTISSPHLPGTYHTAGQKTINPQKFSVTHPSQFRKPPQVSREWWHFFGPKAHQILKIFSLVPPTWSTWSCHGFRSEEEWKGRKIHVMNAGGKNHHQQPSKIMGFFEGDDFGSPWKLEFWASFFVWKPKPSQAKTGFTCLCFHHDFL